MPILLREEVPWSLWDGFCLYQVVLITSFILHAPVLFHVVCIHMSDMSDLCSFSTTCGSQVNAAFSWITLDGLDFIVYMAVPSVMKTRVMGRHAT